MSLWSTREISGQPILVYACDSVHVVGSWSTVLIQIWRGPPSGEAFAGVNRAAQAFVDSHTKPVCCLFIVERSSPPPDDEARKKLATFSRDIVSRMAISAVVAEGGGFRAALVRAVGVTLTTILPHSSKFKFVNDVAVAVRLIEPHLKLPNGGEHLTQAAEVLRAKIGVAAEGAAARPSD